MSNYDVTLLKRKDNSFICGEPAEGRWKDGELARNWKVDKASNVAIPLFSVGRQADIRFPQHSGSAIVQMGRLLPTGLQALRLAAPSYAQTPTMSPLTCLLQRRD